MKRSVSCSEFFHLTQVPDALGVSPAVMLKESAVVRSQFEYVAVGLRSVPVEWNPESGGQIFGGVEHALPECGTLFGRQNTKDASGTLLFDDSGDLFWGIGNESFVSEAKGNAFGFHFSEWGGHDT